MPYNPEFIAALERILDRPIARRVSGRKRKVAVETEPLPLQMDERSPNFRRDATAQMTEKYGDYCKNNAIKAVDMKDIISSS